jgi:hypothetical protein
MDIIQRYKHTKNNNESRGPWWPWVAHQKQLLFSVGNYFQQNRTKIQFSIRNYTPSPNFKSVCQKTQE